MLLDGNGDISFEEFVAVMSRKVQVSYTADEVKDAFKVFEFGRPGFVKCKSLYEAMTIFGDRLSGTA